ncbi:MAG: glycosyltransferase family 39 protein [bacterium]
MSTVGPLRGQHRATLDARARMLAGSTWIWLGGALLAAVWLRCWNLGFGLPDVMQPDEFSVPARAASFIAFPHPDPNPHFFLKPTLSYYAVALAYLVAFPPLRMLGVVPSYAAFLRDQTLLTWIGRGLTALEAVVTVLALFLVVRRGFGVRAALVAAFACAVLPIHVAIAHYVNVDVPMGLFCVLALGACFRYLESGARRDLWMAGCAAGLAASAKYPGAILCVTVSVAYLLAPRRGRWVDLVSAGVASIVAFLATSPYVLLAYREFRAGIGSEAGHMRGLHPGYDLFVEGWVFVPLVYQLAAQWPLCMSWPLYGWGLGSSVAAARRGDRPSRLVLWGYLVPWCAVVGTSTVSFPRYALPVTLGLVILGAAELARWTAAARPTLRRAAMAIGLITAAYAAVTSATLVRKLEPQSAALAARLLEAQAPAGSRIAVAIFFPNVPLDGNRFQVRPIQSVPEWEAASDWADYIVVSSEYALALRRGERPRFAQRAFLERLESGDGWRRVARFAPTPFLHEDSYAALDPYFHNHFHAHTLEIFARVPSAAAAPPAASPLARSSTAVAR